MFLQQKIEGKNIDHMGLYIEAGALEVPGLRVSYSNRLKCNSQGGGAFGAQMNLFSRIARVIKV